MRDSRRLAVMASCSWPHSRQPLGHQLVGDLTVEPGGVGAGLVAEGEEPHPVELGLRQPLEQAVVVVLGLARDSRR